MVKAENSEERNAILNCYRDLLRVCRPNTTRDNKRLIRKAFNLALEAHKGMRRKSGEPYIYHPIAVARICVEEIGLSTTSIVCSLLHDVVEDTDFTLSDIRRLFGDKVATIIDGLTKISGTFESSSSLQAENFRKMLLSLSDDVRVILIKLADRLHNMRTLDSMPPNKQLKISSETLYLYAPLSHRLGLYTIKGEMEDLSMKYTEPDVYKSIVKKLAETEEEREKFISLFTKPIEKTLKEQNISFEILGRTKSIYSIWQKMKKKEIPFEEVYDLFAIRIIIDSPLKTEKADCWRVYSVVTDYYRPNPDRLRDWISTPKANGYESLHTTVMGSTGKWVEVQIRSKRMNEIAEKGYAAHWKYKESPDKSEGALDEWMAKIREMLQSPESDALDFIDDFKLNLFSDEIFVFTPKGELKSLPIDSTALDFAYSIHTQIGNKCIGAKVNHRLVPLRHKLRSGDQIEIISSNKQKPKEDWLKFVVTARAKSKIKSALKEDKRRISDDGKEILERKLKQMKMDFNQQNIHKMVEFFNLNTSQDLFYEFGKGTMGVKEVKRFVQETERGRWLKYLTQRFVKSKQQKTAPATNIPELIKNKPETLVIGENIDNLTYSLASCCNPIPGDDVFGFITINDGVKIHKTNCPNAVQLRSKYAYRVINAKWKEDQPVTFLGGIHVKGIDKVGIVNRITQVISAEENLNIHSINLQTNKETFYGDIMIYVNDTKKLNELISYIRRIEGVKRAYRINS